MDKSKEIETLRKIVEGKMEQVKRAEDRFDNLLLQMRESGADLTRQTVELVRFREQLQKLEDKQEG